MSNGAVGELLRDWRQRRHRSQLDLSLDVGVSARHLSFVETGRSRPSPELVLAVAEHLEVPLQARNDLLLAAGYAPRFSHTPLDDAALARVRASLQRMLDAHSPYPGVVIDRSWNVLLANDAALALTIGVAPHLMEDGINVFRVSLHPEGIAARTTNFEEWGAYLIRQIRREVQRTNDPELRALEEEVRSYPNVAALGEPAEGTEADPEVLVSFRMLAADGTELSLFTTLTTFGTPRDVTLDELSVELYWPADDVTDRVLSGTASTHN